MRKYHFVMTRCAKHDAQMTDYDYIFPDVDHRSTTKSPSESRRSGSRTGSNTRSRPQSTRADAAARKRREMKENLDEAAMELLAHFNHRNLDALLKVTRFTLEGLRKRITTSSMVHYIGGKSG